MHIQHVIDQPDNRKIVRYIINCLDALHDHTNSVFIVSTDKDIKLHSRFKHGLHFVQPYYQTQLDPDCIIFHSVWSNSVYHVVGASMAIQQECNYLPSFDIISFAATHGIKKVIGCNGYLFPMGNRLDGDRGEWPVVGFIYDGVVKAEDGSMLAGIGELVPDCKFISPKGNDEYRSSLFSIGNRVEFVENIIDHIGRCHITIFKTDQDRHDYCPDTLLMAIASDCVPVVSSLGTYKEFLPDNSTVFNTAHQAVQICWKLITQKFLFEDTLIIFQWNYDHNFSPDIFRRNLLRRIKQVVKEHNGSTTTNH